MLRVGTLLRLSSKKQAKRQGMRNGDEADIPTQRAAIARFLEDKLEWKGVKEYVEVESAFKKRATERDVLQDMLGDAKSGAFDVLVVWKGDRLSRRSEDLAGMVRHITQDCGVSIWSVIEGELTARNAMDKLMLAFQGYKNEAESENTSVRVREKKRQMRDAGEWVGGRIPFGYTLVAKKDARGEPVTVGGRMVRELVPSDDESPILREIYRRYISGVGFHSLSRWLNESGMSTRHGGLWYVYTVRTIIMNPFYAGYITSRYLPSKVKGNHPTLIDESVWRQAQDVHAHKADVPRRQQNEQYALTGVLLCGVCGSSMGGTWYSGGGGKRERFRIYRCLSFRTGSYCGNKNHRVEAIEAAFLAVMMAEDGPTQLRRHLADRDTSSRQLIDDYHAMRRATEARLREVSAALDRLVRDHLEGKSMFTPAEVSEWKATYTAEKDALEAKLCESAPTTAAVDWGAFEMAVRELPRRWQYLTPVERKQAALDFCTAFNVRPYLLRDGSVELRWYSSEKSA